MDIEEFVDFVNNKAEKKPIYGNNEYSNLDSSYYKKLSVIENGIIRCPKNRLSYEVIWDKNCPNRNIFILFNPSIANANVLDETLKNCVRICYALQNYSDEKVKCGGMLIYNSFTIRHPQVEDAVRMIDWEYEYANNPIFQLADKYPINISKIIIAWGNDVKTKLNNEYYSHLKDLVYSIKSKKHLVQAYRINKSGAKQPSHPSPRCTSLVKNFYANPKLVEVENL